MRTLRSATGDELLKTALPGDLAAGTPPPTKPAGAARSAKGPDMPRATIERKAECEAQTTRPHGKIRIQQLYAHGVYDEVVVPKL